MAGGSPETLTLPGFVEISYALLAEEHQRINPLKDMLSLTQELSLAPARKDVVRTTVAAQNDQSIAALMAMKRDLRKRK